MLWPCISLIIVFYTCLLGVGVSLFKHNIQFLWMHCQCIKWMPSLCKQINVPSLLLWLTNFRRIYVYYLLQCCTSRKLWTIESSFSIINIPHMYGLLFTFCLSSILIIFFLFMYYTIFSFAFCAVIRVEWREYFFENLDHNFTNLFLQIYKIMLWCHLKSIKSVDTKMSSEEYRESYATMY